MMFPISRSSARRCEFIIECYSCLQTEYETPRIKIVTPFVAAVIAMLTVARSAPAQIIAYDDAGNYLINANWTSGANQGFGFTPWTIVTSGPNNHGTYITTANVPTFVIASVTNVMGTNYTCVWGTFANGTTGTNETTAYRGFANSLGTNTFKLQWGSRGAGIPPPSVATPCMAGAASPCATAMRPTTSGDFQTGARFYLYFLDGSTPNTLYVQDGNGIQSLTGRTFSNLGRGNITNAVQAEADRGRGRQFLPFDFEGLCGGHDALHIGQHLDGFGNH